MPTITVQAGQRSEPLYVAPGSLVTVTPASGASVVVEYTNGSAADVMNGVAAWSTWPRGPSISYAASDMAMDAMYVRLTPTGGTADLFVDASPTGKAQEPFTPEWRSQVVESEPRSDLLFYDDFNRGDTSAGTLGYPAGASAYTMLGLNALVAANDGRVQGRRWVSNAGSVIYATQTLRGPVNRIGAKIVWESGNGGANAGTMAFLISPSGTSNGIIVNAAIHVTMTRTQLVIGYILAQAIVNVETVPLPSTVPLNTEVVCDFRIDGNMLHYSAAGTVGCVKMPMAASIGLGNFATWEHFYAGTLVSDVVRTTAVWAGSASDVARSSLQELCVAAYRFKTTGWLDSSGQGHTLTGNGSPTVVAGTKFGSALNLASASSQFLSATSFSDAVLTGKDFTWVMWVNLTSLPTPGQFMSLLNKGGTSTLEYDLYVDSSGQVQATVSPSGDSTSGFATVVNTTPLVAGTPAFVAFRYRHKDTRLGVSINAGTFATQVTSGLFNGTGLFRVGFANRLGTSHLNGKIEGLSLFSSAPGHGGALSTENLLRLYKDGDGLEFPW